MDIKLLFAAVFLVLFIVLFFIGAWELLKDLNRLVNKGILFYSVTVRRYLYWIVLAFILSLGLSFTVGYLIFSQ